MPNNPQPQRSAAGGVAQFALLCLAIFFGIGLLSTFGDDEEPAASFTSAQVASCVRLIEQAQEHGLIKARPDERRINVDDQLWREFPATSKTGLLQAVACEAFDRPLRQTEYVVAYGHRSGERVAMLTSAGMSFK
jgi:hypothetical protein